MTAERLLVLGSSATLTCSDFPGEMQCEIVFDILDLGPDVSSQFICITIHKAKEHTNGSAGHC